MKSKRHLQKEATRKKIMDSAYLVYAKEGFTASTAVIAKTAAVSHGTLFLHFPTLDNLLACLIDEFGSHMGTKLHMLAENSHSLKELLEAHLDILSQYEDFYIRLITEERLLPEDIQVVLANIKSVASFHFCTLIEKEIARGGVKTLAPHMLFNTWIALVHYYLQNKTFFAPNQPLLQRYKDQLISTYLALIHI